MFQPTGSFKVRGGLAAVAAVLAEDPGTPLVAASAGNHALGLAFAADRLGADVTVVVAQSASAAKVDRIGRFPIQLVRHGATYDEAEAYALALADERGGRFVSPYNDPDVIAGQATVGTELSDQLPGLASVVAPIGGGGLVSGVGLALGARGVALFGVEPSQSAAMQAAVAAGHAVPVEVGPTIADGLAGNIEPGSVTVALTARAVTSLVTVGEDEIRGAIRFLVAEHGLVAEGAGAVGVAALASGRIPVPEGPCAVVVTGRNITTGLLGSILSAPD
jgi:threonine dehydratase